MEQILPPEIMKMMGKLIDPATKLGDMKVNEYNGFRFMSIFHGETVKYAMEEWDIPERAVFVVSFPKTGWYKGFGDILMPVIDQYGILANR